jgi:hypothetical protein
VVRPPMIQVESVKVVADACKKYIRVRPAPARGADLRRVRVPVERRVDPPSPAL